MQAGNDRQSSVSLKQSILVNELCCGCGACAGVCPTGAIEIDIFSTHEPVIDQNKCTSCGLCLAVCPGQGYPVVEWSRKRCGEGTQIHKERGPVRKYLLGHSTDPDIRQNSASGGIATSLMLYLLETGQVDDVSVINMENERPVARLTHDPQVVRDAMMSKYGPVPMLATLIPELRKRPRRVAITFTPCQLGGWLRAVERIPALRKSQIFSIGLFCGQIQNYDSLAAIASTLGVKYPGDAKFVAWRYGPYPGSARFEKPDGTAAEKPLYPWLDVAVPHFSLHRCFLCPDGGNWLADMTLGDIHSGGSDETVIVCRTKAVEAVLQAAQKKGKIVLNEMRPEQVEACVIKHITNSKMLPAIARNLWLKSKRRCFPSFDYDSETLLRSQNSFMRRLYIFKYRITFWARTGWRRSILIRRPRLMEMTGHFLYCFPRTLPGWNTAMRLRSCNRKSFRHS